MLRSFTTSVIFGCAVFGLALWLGLCLGAAQGAAAQPNVTSYARMTAQLQADAARCPLVRLTSIGRSAHGRRDLWLVRLADPGTDPAQAVRVLVLCRQHGDEPASTEAVLGLIHRLAGGSNPSLRASLSHVALYLIPMVNPDGAEADTRVSGVSADLNRDWGVFRQPETRAVAQAARLISPSLVIDAHNWDGNDEYNADCVEVPRETATELGKASHVLQQEAIHDLAASGYAVHPTAWGADTDPRLAHRWFARQNILSVLVETHSGSPADTADFQQRQGLYAALIHGLARRWSAIDTAQKPRLNALEGNGARRAHEAELFPPIPQAASRHLLSLPPGHSFAWLWAIGVYALALWGAGLRRGIGGGYLIPVQSYFTPAQARSNRTRPTLSFRKERVRIRGKASRQRQNGLLSPPFGRRRWRGEPEEVAPRTRPARYSLARKRDGTDIRVRSGQRKAVSSPPR